MVSDKHFRTPVIVPSTSERTERSRGIEQRFCGNRAEATDELGPNDFELPVEEFTAVGGFGRQRVAVSRRTAAEDVENIECRIVNIELNYKQTIKPINQ